MGLGLFDVKVFYIQGPRRVSPLTPHRCLQTAYQGLLKSVKNLGEGKEASKTYSGNILDTGRGSPISVLCMDMGLPRVEPERVGIVVPDVVNLSHLLAQACVLGKHTGPFLSSFPLGPLDYSFCESLTKPQLSFSEPPQSLCQIPVKDKSLKSASRRGMVTACSCRPWKVTVLISLTL